MRHNPLGALYCAIPSERWSTSADKSDLPISFPYHYSNPPPLSALKRLLEIRPLDFSLPGARAIFALSVGAPGPADESFARFSLFLSAKPPIDFYDEDSDEPALRRTPLCRAMTCGAIAEAKALLELGASPNGRPESRGPCPLFSAVSADPCPGMVELLFSYGADPRAVTQAGHNALHCAALAGNDYDIPALLNGGVDPMARAQDGLTPCELALFHGRADFASALEKEIFQRGLGAINNAPSKRLQL